MKGILQGELEAGETVFKGSVGSTTVPLFSRLLVIRIPDSPKPAEIYGLRQLLHPEKGM